MVAWQKVRHSMPSEEKRERETLHSTRGLVRGIVVVLLIGIALNGVYIFVYYMQKAEALPSTERISYEYALQGTITNIDHRNGFFILDIADIKYGTPPENAPRKIKIHFTDSTPIHKLAFIGNESYLDSASFDSTLSAHALASGDDAYVDVAIVDGELYAFTIVVGRPALPII